MLKTKARSSSTSNTFEHNKFFLSVKIRFWTTSPLEFFFCVLFFLHFRQDFGSFLSVLRGKKKTSFYKTIAVDFSLVIAFFRYYKKLTRVEQTTTVGYIGSVLVKDSNSADVLSRARETVWLKTRSTETRIASKSNKIKKNIINFRVEAISSIEIEIVQENKERRASNLEIVNFSHRKRRRNIAKLCGIRNIYESKKRSFHLKRSVS